MAVQGNLWWIKLELRKKRRCYKYYEVKVRREHSSLERLQTEWVIEGGGKETKNGWKTGEGKMRMDWGLVRPDMNRWGLMVVGTGK